MGAVIPVGEGINHHPSSVCLKIQKGCCYSKDGHDIAEPTIETAKVNVVKLAVRGGVFVCVPHVFDPLVQLTTSRIGGCRRCAKCEKTINQGRILPD